MKTNEKMRKALSVLLCVLMLTQYVPVPALAAEPLTVTIDGTDVTLEADGDGCYKIGTANELYAFAALVNGGSTSTSINGKLTADIEVNADTMSETSTDARTWTPIGNSSNRYTGFFDGNGKTISGLYYNNGAVNYVGLFGYVDDGGEVQNVGVVDSYFNGHSYVGGVVGSNNGSVSNCYNTGSVSGASNVGGVVGYNDDNGSVSNCYNTGSVSGSNPGESYYIGGVVGDNSGTVDSCRNEGTVSYDYYVGGVVGHNNSRVTNCYNTGTVSGVSNVGGVAGQNEGSVSNCYNTGSVSGYGSNVGGVVGQNEGTISNSYYLTEDPTDNEGKDSTAFASGEVACLLGSAWGQTLSGENKDAFPVFANGSNTVYQIANTGCKSYGEYRYSNDQSTYAPPHAWSYQAVDSTSTSTITASCANACSDSPVTIKLSVPENLIYDVNPKTVTVTQNPKDTVTGLPNIQYTGTDGTVYESTNAPTDVGSYKATLTIGEGENAATAAVTYTISEADPGMTAPTATNPTYNGNAQALVSGGSATNGTLYYAVTEDTVETAPNDGWSTDVPTGNAAKTYRVWYKVTGKPNYSDTEPDYVDSTIAQKALTITAIEQSITYGENIQEDVDYVTAELAAGDTLTGITLTPSTANVTTNGTITPSNATIMDGEKDVTANYHITYSSGNLTINAKSMTADISGYTGTYDGAAHGITVTVRDPADAKVEYSIDGETWSKTNPQFTDVKDSTTVQYRVTKDNYITISDSASVTINPIEINVTVDAIADQPYTGDPITPAVTITDKDGKLVGSDTLKENRDYTVEYSENNTDVGEVTVTVKDVAGGNYTVSGSGTFRIVQAANEWTTEPSISGWIYGETASKPSMGEAKFGTASVTYSGTANDSTEYTDSATPPDKAGKYTATFTVAGTDNYKKLTYEAPFEISKAMPALGTVTTSIPANSTDMNEITFFWANDAMAGSMTAHDGQTLAWGTNGISFTFTPKDTNNYTPLYTVAPVTVMDTVAPTGTVSIEENSWKDLWNTLTFGLFYKETKTVKVQAADALSGIAKVEYYDSADPLSAEQVKEITNWTDMGEDYAQEVTAEDAKTFIYYIRITDNAGNVAYISTADATYDLTLPAISGITDGNTYYTTQKVTVTDTNLETVTLNDEPVTGEITLAGNVDQTYTIVAADKAGNKTTCTVTMKPIASISAPIDEITETNVYSGNAGTVADVEAAAAAVDTANATEEEKAAIQAITDQCDALQEVIAYAATECERITDAVDSYTLDTVKSTDKDEIEQLIEEVDALLETDNLTDEERTALKGEKTKCENLISKIDGTETLIGQLEKEVDGLDAETVTSTDKAALEQLAQDIEDLLETDNLTKDEQTALETVLEQVKDLLETIENMEEDTTPTTEPTEDTEVVAYDIIQGDGSKWTKGSGKGLSFTANGSFSKFVGIRIDGKEVAKANYDAKSGSTVITLKNSYLETLSAGKHTITVLYTDGETDGTFTISEKAASAATGDQSNILLWSTTLFGSVLALALIVIIGKKFSYKGKYVEN